MTERIKPTSRLGARALVALEARGGAREGKVPRRRAASGDRRGRPRLPRCNAGAVRRQPRQPAAAACAARRHCARMPRRGRRPAAAGRIADDRFRFLGVPAAEGRRRAQAAGAEATVPRSAFQRDGRSRHLHRRLLAARSDFARDRPRRWCRAATSSIRRRRESTRRASSRTSPPTSSRRSKP